MRTSIVLLVVGSLAGCTTASGIAPTHDGHLTVTSYARWDLVSWNHVHKNGVNEARAYCRKYHKEMHEITVHSRGLRGVTRQSVQVVFDCL